MIYFTMLSLFWSLCWEIYNQKQEVAFTILTLLITTLVYFYGTSGRCRRIKLDIFTNVYEAHQLFDNIMIRRGGVQLELRCAQRVGRVVGDPQIDWSFDELLLELNSIDHKLQKSSLAPLQFTNKHSSDRSVVRHAEKTRKPFVMHVSDDERDDNDDDQENNSRHVASNNRFACEETYLSDNVGSDSESASGEQLSLMDKGGVIEGALLELSHEHQLSVAEEIRTQLSAFETDLTNEKDNLSQAISRAEKSKEARRELDTKHDLQYQRQIAEALDNYLADVRRHHEYKSQIEEKKIRDDAAIEEAKRKQIYLQEEKIRQEKMEVEEAKRQAEKKKEEETKAAALEAERAAKEAAESQKKTADALTASQEAVSKGSSSGGDNGSTAGTVLKGVESALKLEERRLQMYNQMVGEDFELKKNTPSEYYSHVKQMFRCIRTISGSEEKLRPKADELLKLMNSVCPQAISMGIFAERICMNQKRDVLYAYGRVIVMVTSQIPPAMEILIGKLNSCCMFTVPKYISYSEAAFESRAAHLKAIGFQEEDGKLESTNDYLERITSHMRLYGALIQTEVNGIQNLHGIEEGWKWLARFLNAIPADLYSVAALLAFIEIAGYALHRRYKNQFKKLLNIIYREFLQELRESDDQTVINLVMSFEDYIESNAFLKEPKGWRLKDYLNSSKLAPTDEPDHQHSAE